MNTLTSGNILPMLDHLSEGAMKTLTKPDTRTEEFLEEAFWIGTNLCRIRAEKKLTQEALANAAGVSVRRLRDLENAPSRSNASVETLASLAHALGIKVEVFFKRHKDVAEFVGAI